MGRLHAEYLDLVRVAAERGVTEATGLTPREHAARLLATGLVEADLTDALTRIMERSVYGREGGLSEDGHGLILRIRERLTALPITKRIRRVEESHEEEGDPRFNLPIGILVTLGFVVLLAFLVSRGCGIASGIGISTGWRASRIDASTRLGSVAGITGWNSTKEKDAIRSAGGDWDRPRFNTTIENRVARTVYGAPDATDTSALWLDTGTDHKFTHWKEPFSPPLSLRHRTRVSVGVDANHRLLFSHLPDAGSEAGVVYRPTTWRAEFSANLTAGEHVPIPVPTPHSEIVSFSVKPSAGVRLERGFGDERLMVADRTGVYRVNYQAKGDAAYFTGPLPAISWGTARRLLQPQALPENVQRDAERVLARIGGIPAPTYRETVRRLQAYFSGFAVAPLEAGEYMENDYLTIALARKGVCGHRAHVFTITAIAAGIPARYVANEIHAMAEVQLPDGRWRQLDLRLLDNENANHDLRGYVFPGGSGSFAVLGSMALFAIILGMASVYRRRRREEDALRNLRAFDPMAREEVLDRAALAWLTERTLGRVAERIGVAGEDDDALRNALDGAGLPYPIKCQAQSLLNQSQPGSVGAIEFDRVEVESTYWSIRNLSAWLDGRMVGGTRDLGNGSGEGGSGGDRPDPQGSETEGVRPRE